MVVEFVEIGRVVVEYGLQTIAFLPGDYHVQNRESKVVEHVIIFEDLLESWDISSSVRRGQRQDSSPGELAWRAFIS